MKRAVLILCAAILVCSCAAKPPKRQYASADEKNIETFVEKYVAAWNTGEEKAILRLYADDARMVARLAHTHKVLRKKDLAANLSYILKEQARAKLNIELQKPLRIEIRAETAQVRALLRLSFTDQGDAATVLVDQRLDLRRENYFWKIVREISEPVGAVAPDAPPDGS